VNLRETGERALIRSIRERFQVKLAQQTRKEGTQEWATVGIGDDAAIFDFPAGYSAVFCSDLLVENSHFIRELHPPKSVGYKSVAVNVSDIGAMGGIPMHFLISLAAPGEVDYSWMEGFWDGVEQACRNFEISLVGGDTSSSERIVIDVSMVGRVRTGEAVLRSGAKPGDGIYLTGHLGSSMLGLECLKAGKSNDPSVKRHLYPEPRYRVGSAMAGRAHAMIDVSDGLSTDLSHILEESKVSARIYKNRIPSAVGAEDAYVLHGGEEYELIIVGADLPSSIEGVPLTRIGEIIDSAMDNQLFLIDGTRQSALTALGWQHFE
jgi:thiamine-monophosphate kinase